MEPTNFQEIKSLVQLNEALNKVEIAPNATFSGREVIVLGEKVSLHDIMDKLFSLTMNDPARTTKVAEECFSKYENVCDRFDEELNSKIECFTTSHFANLSGKNNIAKEANASSKDSLSTGKPLEEASMVTAADTASVMSAGLKDISIQDLIAQNPILHALKEQITPMVHQQESSVKDINKMDRTKAATIIQKAFRNHQIKMSLLKNPYIAYLSMLEKEDPQRFLSELMFGRHIAEIRQISPHLMRNPGLNPKELGLSYHRDSQTFSNFIISMQDEFNIPSADRQNNLFIPVSLLTNTPIEEILNKYCPDCMSSLTLITDEHHSIALLQIPANYSNKSKIEQICRSAGLIASPWDLSSNISPDHRPLESASLITGVYAYDDTIHDAVSQNWDQNLPTTKEELLQSEIFLKAKARAGNSNYPTHILAKNLIKLLENSPQMDSGAVKRIAKILELMNTFYTNNYHRYAFGMYIIIHELTLALMKQDPAEVQNAFSAFEQETKKTLLNAFGMQEDQLSNVNYGSAPANSGTNAYALAISLAENMATQTGQPPKIKIYKPSYYEFDTLASSNSTNTEKDANIFVITCGPVLDGEGLHAGLDINKLVKRIVIKDKHSTPITLVIDATTTLYKNFRLDPEVQELIEQGQLSLIIHESHQKFGLLHSDQAQYGQVSSFCSKQSFSKETIEQMQKNAQHDFEKHPDMRIGAFIGTHCAGTLEELKQKQFSNGAIFRNLLTQSLLARKDVIIEEDMLENLDELYFLYSDKPEFSKALTELIEGRDSFGHFLDTWAVVRDFKRLSPGGSDTTDTLITAAQVYMHQFFPKPEKILSMLIEQSRHSISLTLEEQIIALALLNNTVFNLAKSQPKDKLLITILAMQNVLNQCKDLRERPLYVEALRAIEECKQDFQGLDRRSYHSFWNAAMILHQQGISSSVIMALRKNPTACRVIARMGSVSMDAKFIQSLLAMDSLLQEDLTDFLRKVDKALPIIKSNQGATPLTAESFIELVQQQI